MPFITIKDTNYNAEHVASWKLTPSREEGFTSRHLPDGSFSAQPQVQFKTIPASLILKFQDGYGPKITPIILTGDQAEKAAAILEVAKSSQG